jgi:hypothetical protein
VAEVIGTVNQRSRTEIYSTLPGPTATAPPPSLRRIQQERLIRGRSNYPQGGGVAEDPASAMESLIVIKMQLLPPKDLNSA